MANLDLLKQTKDALDKVLGEKKRNEEIMRGLGPAIIETLKPVLDEMASNSKLSKGELLNALSNIKIDSPSVSVPKAEVSVTIPEIKVPTPQVTVNVADIPAPIIPEIKIPKIVVPEPKVTVNVPAFPKIPDLKWPEEEMPIRGWVNLMGVDLGHPLPVQLRDAKGNPINLFENLTQIVSGGGGLAKIVKVSGMPATTGVVTINPDGNPTYASANSGLTDAELRASSVDVQQASGANWSVAVSNLFSAVGDTGGGEGVTNALRVVQASGAVASVNIVSGSSSGTQYNQAQLPDTITGTAILGSDNAGQMFALRTGSGAGDTTVLRVQFATDSIASVNVNNPIGQGDAATALRVVVAGNSDVSVTATQTGTWNIATVTGVTNSIAASIVDSGGVQYSGSNPLPITGNVNVNGSLNSVLATGDVLHDAVDDGQAPLKIGGVAIQANPVAVAAGDRTKFTADDLGRQLVRPVQVRDLIVTAYSSPANGTETTLLTGVATAYFDLIYVMMANSSDAAVLVDVRPSTAGSVVMTVAVPANGTAGVSLPIPIPQQATGDGTGGSWTVDLPDITGTTVYVTALFSREV